MERIMSTRVRSFVLLFAVPLALSGCPSSGAEDCHCDAGTCPALADVSCPGGQDVVCPATPDVDCLGCQDAGCPAAPDVVRPSCPDVWTPDLWAPDAGDEPDLPIWPVDCLTDADCRPDWLLAAGFEARCHPEDGCEFQVPGLQEVGPALLEIWRGAEVYLAEEGRLTDDGHALGCTLPVAQAITPLEGTCCGNLGGPDSDDDGYTADGTRPYWDERSWNALAFGFDGEAPSLPLRVRGRQPVRSLAPAGPGHDRAHLRSDQPPCAGCLLTIEMTGSSARDEPCTLGTSRGTRPLG